MGLTGRLLSKQLAYEPGRLYAIRYIRPKYASPDRRNGADTFMTAASGKIKDNPPEPSGPED